MDLGFARIPYFVMLILEIRHLQFRGYSILTCMKQNLRLPGKIDGSSCNNF